MCRTKHSKPKKHKRHSNRTKLCLRTSKKKYTARTIKNQTESNLQLQTAWTRPRCSLSAERQSCRQSQSCTASVSSPAPHANSSYTGRLGAPDSQHSTCALGLPGLLSDRYIRRDQTPILALSENTGLEPSRHRPLEAFLDYSCSNN